MNISENTLNNLKAKGLSDQEIEEIHLMLHKFISSLLDDKYAN